MVFVGSVYSQAGEAIGKALDEKGESGMWLGSRGRQLLRSNVLLLTPILGVTSQLLPPYHPRNLR